MELRFISSPTFHWCYEGPPGHQGSRPGCSPRGAGPGVGWVSLAQSPKGLLSEGNLTGLVPTAKTATPSH